MFRTEKPYTVTSLFTLVLGLVIFLMTILQFPKALSPAYLNPSITKIQGQEGQIVNIYFQWVEKDSVTSSLEGLTLTSDNPKVAGVVNNHTVELKGVGKGFVTATYKDTKVKVPYEIKEDAIVKLQGNRLHLGFMNASDQSIANTPFMVDKEHYTLSTNDKGVLSVDTSKVGKEFSIYIINSTTTGNKAYKLVDVRLNGEDAYITTFSADLEGNFVRVNTDASFTPK